MRKKIILSITLLTMIVTILTGCSSKVTVLMNSSEYKWIDDDTIQIGSDNDEDPPTFFR